ncbi:MAG: hypothetical protein HOE40_04000 [Candidatus Pacebacteria bacterium]|jgi:hypothetical protein|nr:hypothetical protein [Candidatus Paceibacterota bacterium]
MKNYIGTKIVQAIPEKKFKEQIDGYKVIYAGGYESWSPKDVFEQCYREISDEESDMLQIIRKRKM